MKKIVNYLKHKGNFERKKYKLHAILMLKNRLNQRSIYQSKIYKNKNKKLRKKSKHMNNKYKY